VLVQLLRRGDYQVISRMCVASSIPHVQERTKMAEKVHGLFLVKKKNTKSGVWQHFALKATENGSLIENEQDQPICRFCG